MTEQRLIDRLDAQIESAKSVLKGVQMTREQAEAICKEYRDAVGRDIEYKDVTLSDPQRDIVRQGAAAVSNAYFIIDQLEQSKRMELVQVERRYVLTDGHIVSPAGFHPSELVFIINPIWVQTNNPPGIVAGGLQVYDMLEIKTNWTPSYQPEINIRVAMYAHALGGFIGLTVDDDLIWAVASSDGQPDGNWVDLTAPDSPKTVEIINGLLGTSYKFEDFPGR